MHFLLPLANTTLARHTPRLSSGANPSRPCNLSRTNPSRHARPNWLSSSLYLLSFYFISFHFLFRRPLVNGLPHQERPTNILYSDIYCWLVLVRFICCSPFTLYVLHFWVWEKHKTVLRKLYFSSANNRNTFTKMSDNNQPSNHHQKYHIFKMGDTPVENVERSRSVNTPAPAADVGWRIDQMNDNYAAASASASAAAAASGRPANAAVANNASNAIAAVANNASNAIAAVTDKAIVAANNSIAAVAGKAFTALANTEKAAATQGGSITHKRGRTIPVSKDEGCSNYEEVKEEVPACKKAK